MSTFGGSGAALPPSCLYGRRFQAISIRNIVNGNMTTAAKPARKSALHRPTKRKSKQTPLLGNTTASTKNVLPGYDTEESHRKHFMPGQRRRRLCATRHSPGRLLLRNSKLGLGNNQLVLDAILPNTHHLKQEKLQPLSIKLKAAVLMLYTLLGLLFTKSLMACKKPMSYGICGDESLFHI